MCSATHSQQGSWDPQATPASPGLATAGLT